VHFDEEMGFQFLCPRSTVLSPSDPRPPTVDDDMILVVLNFCRKEFFDILLVIMEFSRVEPGIRRVGGVGVFVIFFSCIAGQVRDMVGQLLEL